MQYPVTVVASRPLSKQEHTTYLTMSTSSCQGLIENALSLSSLAATTTRHCATTSRDATIHRGRDCVDPSLPALCAVTKIEATLPSIAAQYTLGTLSDKLAHNLTDDVAMVNQKLAKLGSHVLARQQLYCLGGTTTDMPYHYAGIVWYAHSSLPLCASRDFCVLEYHNQVEVMDWQSKRRRGWIRCLQSVDVIGCPSLRASRGHIRSSMFRSGQLFVETDCPGMLTVYSVAVHHYNGLLPPGGAAKLMRREVATILKLEKAMATQRVLQRLRTVEPKQLQTATFRATRVHCPQCHRSRSWFRHQRACAICGEAVCASCGREWSVPGVTPAAFVCLHCFCPKGMAPHLGVARIIFCSHFARRLGKNEQLREEHVQLDQLDAAVHGAELLGRPERNVETARVPHTQRLGRTVGTVVVALLRH
ncbi:hypothetical protein, variant [Aphanomyces invadans]|uniref:FYVE-type domain-containing protein n=1 Tax=Aphanomyces invadans TaxID=157072 RepID=A0A024TTD2_9STRA|nr:hypothetical protein, variant [Aphanomyces invadans]ETV97298.1 hypothetical protein, variant [Aphanomyces invadans]|eukprot:XP_008874006.1 hypothetical protein, variant [Aphanomyces invadans]